MGPEDHTPEWDAQVETIVNVMDNSDITKAEMERVIVMYAMDESFSRSAVLQARHEILTAWKENEQTTDAG